MTTDLFDLTGKIALVTGASRGIGEVSSQVAGATGRPCHYLQPQAGGL